MTENTVNPSTPEVPSLSEVQRLLSLLPQEDRLKLVPVLKPKAPRKVRKGERAIFVESVTDFQTNKDRLSAHEIVPGRVTILSGITKTDAGNIFDASQGRMVAEDLESVEVAAGVAWISKNGKVRSTTSGQVTSIVKACLDRIQSAPHGSFEQGTAKKKLKALQAA